MGVQLDVQYACESGQDLPAVQDFQKWAELALCDNVDAEVVIRIVDENESRELNHQYRGKNKSTNVLSFPMELPEQLASIADENILGDLVICAPVVSREAVEQNKPLQHHWAHMVIHGMLHLQGHDHIEDDEAAEMESLEIKLLQQLGIANPYGTDQ